MNHQAETSTTVKPAISGAPVLEVRNLETYFDTKRGHGAAVNGVSFSVPRGETFGLLGESGSGKSVALHSIMRLLPRTATIAGGEVLLDGENLLLKSRVEMQRIRGEKIAMVLQDPLAALNPVYTVGFQINEPLRIHEGLNRRDAKRRAIELLELLHVSSAEQRLRSYPHQFSGGMRQRVVGAIALASNPKVLLADEPTTSLDVTVQAAYLDLLNEIQDKTGLAIVFVTHDLGVAAAVCDRVGVMYAGRLVETGPTEQVVHDPKHPYTQALRAAIPTKSTAALKPIEGQPPSIFAIPPGCPFAPRCPHVMNKCLAEAPQPTQIGPDHSLRCWLYE
jgi:oligopeptide/dipeptide ABC transporter ATP-binding protein